MGGLISRAMSLFGGGSLQGEIVHIHGTPYRFQRLLGRGGFGAVYSAKTPHGPPVAVKIINLSGLPPDHSKSLVQSYLNEVSHLERLRQESRHVVVIHDFDFDASSGRAYIVMELGGDNLSKLIDKQRLHFGQNLNPMMIKGFWRQMVSIVATLHGNSIVHMDLKPDNLILFGRTLKIADLGVSRKADALGYARMGTPFFSAPEVMKDTPGLRRFYGPQADIWSLGAILYYMVYGRPPSYHPLAANPPIGRPPYPDAALRDVLHRTLVLNPELRADITSLLFHPYTNS